MRGAHPERELERAIEQSGALHRGERILIACSGGPDSIALSAALCGIASRFSFTIVAAFVNHATRCSAWQDECVGLALAARYGIPLDVMALQMGKSDEQYLRTARYAALAQCARRRDCSVIATAHHAEDQSETVLLALFRGAGPDGLGGMPSRRNFEEGLDVARPLIGVSSETLRAYCHANALPYAVDPTNAQTDLRRNAVREALTTLRPLFPGLDRAVARAAQLTAHERDAIPRAALRRSIRKQLAAEDSLCDIDFSHVEAAVRALECGSTGSFHMKPGIVLRIEAGSIAGIERA